MTTDPQFHCVRRFPRDTTALDPNLLGQGIGRSAERRRSPRISEAFPVTVRALDHHGQRFRTETVVDNLSAKGLFVRLQRCVERGARLFALLRLAPGSDKAVPAATFALRGVVKRVVPLSDGGSGVGVEFTKQRSL